MIDTPRAEATGLSQLKFCLARLRDIFQGDLASQQSYRFSDFETALVRLGKGWCRKMKCTKCPMRAHCHKVVI